MTTILLVDDLKRFEGEPGTGLPALTAYRDTGGVWTIGWGHTGPEVIEGLVWTYAQCQDALDADIETTERGLDRAIPWWRNLNDARQDALCNMAFNLGVHGVMGFHHMLAGLQSGDWQEAHDGAVDSLWDHQVGATRADFVADMFLTGERLAA